MYKKNKNLNFISVIVPVYNEEKNIKFLIESLLNLNYPKNKYEIIIVDNNSQDKTSEIIKEFRQVKYLLEEKQSSYAARNKGIRNAKGDIFAFTDGDCVVDKSWLKNAVEIFERREVDIVSGKIVFTTGNKLSILALYDTLMSEDSQRMAAESGRSAGGNIIARREVFERIGLFDERLVSGGDGEWTTRATEAGFRLEYCDGVRVYHSVRSLKEVLERSIRIGYGKGRIRRLHSIPNRHGNLASSTRVSYTKLVSHGIDIYKQRLRAVNRAAQKGHLGIGRRLQFIFLGLILQTLAFYGWVKGQHKNV